MMNVYYQNQKKKEKKNQCILSRYIPFATTKSANQIKHKNNINIKYKNNIKW